MPEQDLRLQQLEVWLDEQLPILFNAQDWGPVPPATLTAASSDASFRRYFRWEGGGRTFVVMDAPPPQENCKPFVDIAHLLAKSGINVPKIYAEDLPRGFLLLNDLGRNTYLDVIDEQNADQLFADAIDALLAFQQLPMDTPLPSYDVALLRRELELFPEWYVRRHLGIEFDTQQQALWQRVSEHLIDSALAQPMVLVHRDYMPRNLMISQPNPGILAMAKPAPAPISVPGHNILLPRFQQGFDLRQTLQRTDINPASRHLFPRYQTFRHGLPQQRRQLEGTRTATREQLGVEH